jgi:hypothetical protein
MAGIRIPHVETVLVENSDNRLAAVEEAKMTGQPFQSTAANESVIVPHDVAEVIFEEFSQEDTYVGRFGATAAAHLEDYHEKVRTDPDFIPQTNEEKAQAHHAYSAELVRKQMEDNAKVLALIAEGFEPSLAVQQANLERAREHEEKSIEYAKLRAERAKNAKGVWEVVDEAVKLLKPEDLEKPVEKRASKLEKVVEAPDVSESQAREALITKDDIIATKEDFKAHAMSHEELRERDRPAIPILESAGSPEQLREDTAIAQIYADNPTEEATKAQVKMNKAIAEKDGEETSAHPFDAIRDAENSVNDVEPSDEMPENPSE